MTALSEWASGEMEPCSGHLFMSHEGWPEKVEPLVCDLGHYKEQHPGSWDWVLADLE